MVSGRNRHATHPVNVMFSGAIHAMPPFSTLSPILLACCRLLRERSGTSVVEVCRFGSGIFLEAGAEFRLIVQSSAET